MTGLRVLHVIESMTRGGAESLILEHVRHASPGTRTTVCALNRGGPALDQAAALGADAVLLGKGAQRLAGIRRVAQLIRERGIDVVNGHNPTGALYATLGATLGGATALVRTEHSIHYPGRHSALYARAIEPLLTLRAGAVICVCEAVRASHARRLAWAADRFVTIDNGISEGPPPPSRAEARRMLDLGPEEAVLLTVGSLTPQKAQRDLLDAFARVAADMPRARLLIAGGGALEDDLKTHTAALGLEARVRFLGPREDVAELLAACDVFVLSSVREGLSVTLLEAMRAGRAAVATRVGGSADVVDDGRTGRIVPPSEPTALARALTELLGDADGLEAMGLAGRRRFESRFRAERMVADTEALYRRLLWGGQRPDATPIGAIAAPGTAPAGAAVARAAVATARDTAPPSTPPSKGAALARRA